MSLSHLLLLISAGVILPLLAAYAYLKLYQAKIDKAIETGKQISKPMISSYQVANVMKVIIVIAVILPVLSYLREGRTGAQEIETAVHQRAVEDGMKVELVIAEKMAAALYYTDDRSDCSFALYENRGKYLDDYCFIHGGSSASIEKSVRVFRIEKSGELVLFSMNRLGIAKIACHDGNTYQLDPESPFALIIPSGGADVYDKNGDLIDLKQNRWYEITTKD